MGKKYTWRNVVLLRTRLERCVGNDLNLNRQQRYQISAFKVNYRVNMYITQQLIHRYLVHYQP